MHVLVLRGTLALLQTSVKTRACCTPNVPVLILSEVCLLILVVVVVISVVVSCYWRKKMAGKRLAQEILEGHLAVAQLEDGCSEQVGT